MECREDEYYSNVTQMNSHDTDEIPSPTAKRLEDTLSEYTLPITNKMVNFKTGLFDRT